MELIECSARIVVVGTTGSGKTALARRLAASLGVPHIELDALYWEPDWRGAAPEVFRERAAAATLGGEWVCDGNYHTVRDIVWGRATVLVWLDYPLGLILWQLVRRTLARIRTREELWNGNREGWHALLGPDSLIAWAFRTHWRRRREYPRQLEQYRQLRVVRLRSRGDAQRFVESLCSAGGAFVLPR